MIFTKKCPLKSSNYVFKNYTPKLNQNKEGEEKYISFSNLGYRSSLHHQQLNK